MTDAPSVPATTPIASERFRNSLAFLLVAAFIAILPLLVFKSIPTANKDIIVYMIGQLSGMALTALGFYFVNKAGQDALDAKRADNTSKMADAVVAAANAGTTSTPDAAAGAREVAGAAVARAADIAADAAGVGVNAPTDRNPPPPPSDDD